MVVTAGPSPCQLLHFEVRFGKTLKGTDRRLATMARHKDVVLCAVGAICLNFITRFGSLLSGREQLSLDADSWSTLAFPSAGKSQLLTATACNRWDVVPWWMNASLPI